MDAGDLAALASLIGRPPEYSICFDYNEDGSVDAGDPAYFANAIGTRCH